ncbi:hypothetical protein GF366_00455 [Candidatus Peregrinibacteria bacterium]|nr:hypothetical protein [Candidatus Peregrinibacteria bacterium]
MFVGFFKEYPTYTEALGIGEHGQEGYIETVDGVRREEGYMENVLGYCYNREGYIESLGIAGRCLEGYIERVLMDLC